MAHASNCRWAAPLDFFIVFHFPTEQCKQEGQEATEVSTSSSSPQLETFKTWSETGNYLTILIAPPQHLSILLRARQGWAMPSACLSLGLGLDLGHCDKEFFAFLSKSLHRAFPFFVTWQTNRNKDAGLFISFYSFSSCPFSVKNFHPRHWTEICRLTISSRA